MWRSLLALWLVLYALGLHAESFEPRIVAKNGSVEVPDGMHLVVDRAGQRWLLPIAMQEPPEKLRSPNYFVQKSEPKITKKIGSHNVLSAAKSAQDTIVASDIKDSAHFFLDLPKALSDVLFLEKAANRHAQENADLRSLGKFAPGEFTSFELPYIPIPEKELGFSHISEYANKETKKLLRFRHKGENYIRFFIHPNYVKAYEKLIQKHGIVYHYHAMTTSSPRSLILVDPNNTKRPHWVKVSLHRKIEGSVRINSEKKAHRAIMMSEALMQIPKKIWKTYQLAFMAEPAAFTPKGMISSTIHREIPAEFLRPSSTKRWIPAFILQNTGDYAIEGMNVRDLSEAMDMRAKDFVAEHIIRPLLRAYLQLGMLEGLPGELHTQNFYFELKKQGKAWVPSGRLLLKDNDGFRFDTELALRQGRNLNDFAKFDKPFVWGKYSNTIGKGGDGIPFLGAWYYKLIRNVNGFETLSAYMLRVLKELEPRSRWNKDRIQKVFDQIAMQEAERITDISIRESEFGYGKDKGLSRILMHYRSLLSQSVEEKQRQHKSLQDLLAKEWARLEKQERRSALRRSIGQSTYYVYHQAPDGAIFIEARSAYEHGPKDPTIGFAVLEAVGSKEYKSFMERIKNLSSQPLKTKGGVCRALF
tara:strand:- start:4774 stop:6705 length:1932 start_codon:yes stop_codon:yes gene_type:complete